MNGAFIVVFLISFFVGAGCMSSIQSEVARIMHKPFHSDDVRYSLDDYMWAEIASASLRRRAIICQLCFIFCSISLLFLFFFQEPQTNHSRGGTVLCALFTVVGVGNLAWKLYRRGR
jgi:hypothetical protein